MFIRDATRRSLQPRSLVISYSIPAIINLVKEHRSRVNSARAVRRRTIIPAILLRDAVERPSSVSLGVKLTYRLIMYRIVSCINLVVINRIL